MNEQEELEFLRKENALLQKENAELKERLRNAKDPTPIKKVSFVRVKRLADLACLTLLREGSKFFIKLGNKIREFRRLKDVWEFLSREEWELGELFPEPIRVEKPTHKPCKYCGTLIKFTSDDWVKWIPFEENGTRHRCPNYGRNQDELDPLPATG